MKFRMERKLERINNFSSDLLDQMLLVCEGDDDDLDVQSVVSVILDGGKADPIETKFDDPLSAMLYFRDQKAHWVQQGYKEVKEFTSEEELEKIKQRQMFGGAGGSGGGTATVSSGSVFIYPNTTIANGWWFFGGGGGGGNDGSGAISVKGSSNSWIPYSQITFTDNSGGAKVLQATF